ncbi:hypothetical protein AMTR_s00096p00128670 [Amborella trichopoda]|uniref:Uncharacterized protein n=1 Tax=Amborella trichopoda TaxID=13333 RepID=W1P435_AMBTC|nr:hypothetical protein AMTR_s00096p00128670 [Amborella trichopoda]
MAPKKSFGWSLAEAMLHNGGGWGSGGLAKMVLVVAAGDALVVLVVVAGDVGGCGLVVSSFVKTLSEHPSGFHLAHLKISHGACDYKHSY